MQSVVYATKKRNLEESITTIGGYQVNELSCYLQPAECATTMRRQDDWRADPPVFVWCPFQAQGFSDAAMVSPRTAS
ncbi:MAG: hypothetical protein Kow0020_04480 [Wenzhouxiangellaceae bacterium]